MTESGQKVVSDRRAMISGMTPRLMPGRFVFRRMQKDPEPETMAVALCLFREAEGVSLILPEARAEPDAEQSDLVMRQITLMVMSSLEGVGLTAAVSRALADAGIPCNMVAAYAHDHVFVPEAQAEEALTLLEALSRREGGAS